MEFDVVLEKDEDGVWVATVPALQGCHTQGRTRKEALEHVKEAIALCLEDEKPAHVAVELAKVRVEA